MFQASPGISSCRALLGLICLGAGLLAVPAAAEPPAGIHVNGIGEVQVVPDMARVSLEVRREGEDAAALKAELDTVTAAVLELIRELDIERRDVTAAAVSIYPRYQRPDAEQVPSGVIATRNIEVTLRNLEQIGALINGALERGANGIGGVALDAANRTELERKALDAAIDDARREAEQIAERFDVSLGTLLDVTTGYHQVEPMRMVGAAEMRTAKDSFEPGELTIRRDVQATFGIRP